MKIHISKKYKLKDVPKGYVAAETRYCKFYEKQFYNTTDEKKRKILRKLIDRKRSEFYQLFLYGCADIKE